METLPCNSRIINSVFNSIPIVNFCCNTTHRNVRFGYGWFDEVPLGAAAALLLLLLQQLLPDRIPRVDRHDVGPRPPRDEVRPHI